jgi:hypothetical protein
MVITGFALLMLLPGVYLVLSSMQSYQAEATAAQASAIARTIVAQAEQVYHHGPPSRLTVQVRVPAGIYSGAIVQNRFPGCQKCTEVRFYLQDGSVAYASTGVDLRSEMASYYDDNGYLVYPLPNATIGEGTRNFVVEVFSQDATHDYVNLTSP